MDSFKEGFLQACSEIKDRVSAAHQQVNSTESHKIIDWIWDELKKIELQKLGREPFGEITKKTEPPGDA